VIKTGLKLVPHLVAIGVNMEFFKDINLDSHTKIEFCQLLFLFYRLYNKSPVLKKNLFTVFLVCCALQVYAQKRWEPLQVELSFLSLSLKSQYKLSYKTSVDIGVGYGAGTISSMFSNRYEYPKSNVNSDIWLVEPFISPFYQVGVQYRLKDYSDESLLKQPHLYLRGVFKHYFPATTLLGGAYSLYHNYRTKLTIGRGNYWGKHANWLINWEVGATLWHNYDFSHISAFPCLNLRLCYSAIRPQ